MNTHTRNNLGEGARIKAFEFGANLNFLNFWGKAFFCTFWKTGEKVKWPRIRYPAFSRPSTKLDIFYLDSLANRPDTGTPSRILDDSGAESWHGTWTERARLSGWFGCSVSDGPRSTSSGSDKEWLGVIRIELVKVIRSDKDGVGSGDKDW